jgi:hypothetical protein
MKGVSGLDFQDPATRRLFKIMVELMQEFLPDDSSSGGSVVIDGRSVSSQDSPTNIIHHYIHGA